MPVGVRRARVLAVDPDAGEQIADLADALHGHAGVVELQQVGARGRLERQVAPPGGTPEVARLALERPRDHAPDGVLAGHHRPRGAARLDELVLAQPVVVGGELEHRVGRRVEDHLARAQVVLAELLDDGDAVGRAVGAEAQAGRALELGHERRREAARIGRRRGVGDDAHELPVTGGRVLARTERVQPPVERGRRRRRDTGDRDDRAEAEALERRQTEPADRVGDVRERVRLGRVAVGLGVRERADAAGVEHDHGRAALRRAPHSGAIVAGARGAAISRRWPAGAP